MGTVMFSFFQSKIVIYFYVFVIVEYELGNLTNDIKKILLDSCSMFYEYLNGRSYGASNYEWVKKGQKQR